MKKFLLMIIMFFLITSKVQAVATKDFISLESTSETIARPLEFWNNLLNEYFGRTDIDLSTFQDNQNFLNSWLLNKTNYGQVLIPMSDGKIFASIGYNKSVSIVEDGTNGYYITGSAGYSIDVNNKTIRNGANYEETLLYKNSSLNQFLEEGNLEEDYTSDDYKRSLIFNYCLYFNGYIKNRNQLILNEQKYNKNNLWSYDEDGAHYDWSGDILLYEDFFEVKGFYTNSKDYSLYLLRYIVNTQFGEFILPDNYSWYEISKPNISNETQIYQISNISNAEENYYYVYAIGIGTSDTPNLIQSEWFDADENMFDFMSSPSFRLRYYVEDLPNFFIVDDNPSGEGTQRPSGDIANGVVDGNENYWGNQNDLNGSKQEELISSKVDEVTEQISGDLAENEIFGILKTYEDKLFGGFTGEQDFKISWNNISYADGVIIPAGEINFSEICRENEALGRVKTTINIILGFMLLYNCVIYLYNLLLATLGIDNPYLYEKPQDITTTSYSVDMKTGKTTETKTTKRKDGIIFTTRRDI